MARRPTASGTARLNPLEEEVVGLFVQYAAALSLPKSVGEIYGLLFSSTVPLALDEIAERLRISKGSASQGLRFLRNLGAVHPTYVAGDRRDHFVVEDRVRNLLSGLLRERVAPQLETSRRRLVRLRELTGPDLPAELRQRMDRLQSWNKKLDRVLPWLERMFVPW